MRGRRLHASPLGVEVGGAVGGLDEGRRRLHPAVHELVRPFGFLGVRIALRAAALPAPRLFINCFLKVASISPLPITISCQPELSTLQDKILMLLQGSLQCLLLEA